MKRTTLTIALGLSVGVPAWATAADQGQETSPPTVEFFAFEVETEQPPIAGEERIVPLTGPSARELQTTGTETAVPVLPDVELQPGQIGWFESLDLDDSGYINAFEAQAAPSDEFNRATLEQLDRDGNRRVDLTEFSAFEVEQMPALPAIQEGLLIEGEGYSVPVLRR